MKNHIEIAQNRPYRSASNFLSLQEVFSELSHLEGTYPGFRQWFWNKVAPGIETGSRALEVLERNGSIAAVGIAKNDSLEKKICTIWVAKNYAGRGFGIRLLDWAMEWLESDYPLATVCEERDAEFRRIFIKRGFELVQIADSYYRIGRKEFAYNGRIEPKLS